MFRPLKPTVLLSVTGTVADHLIRQLNIPQFKYT